MGLSTLKMSLNGCKIKVGLNTPKCVSGVSTTTPPKNGVLRPTVGVLRPIFDMSDPKTSVQTHFFFLKKKRSLHLEFQEKNSTIVFQVKKSTCTACTIKNSNCLMCDVALSSTQPHDDHVDGSTCHHVVMLMGQLVMSCRGQHHITKCSHSWVS